MITFPNAKINLGLRILEKRSDGFHNLETCYYPIGWKDGLEFVESKKTQFSDSGIIIPGNREDNICLKAYKLFKKDFQLPNLCIHLHKAIPVGAGLGGGSSDATHTLMFLNEQYNLMLEEDLLCIYAEQLGSDCAFFVQNQPAMGFNKGEELKPIDVNLTGKYAIVVYPAVHVSTAEAYAGIIPSIPESSLEDILLNVPLEEWREHVFNDFEPAIFEKHPLLESIKTKMYNSGAIFASMTGSGSAIFGIFNEAIEIDFPETYQTWSDFL